MVETGKPPENGEARETGIPNTFSPWPNEVGEIDDLGFEVLSEAMVRIGAPLDAAERELLDRLRNLLEAELSTEANGKALELLERVTGVAGSRHTLVIDLSLRIVPELPWKNPTLRDFLEATLQGSLRAAGLDTTESVDDFVKSSLRAEVDYVRESLPDFPADWYTHDWAVARLRQRVAEARDTRAGETTS